MVRSHPVSRSAEFKLRISKLKAVAAAALFAVITAWLTPWFIDGVRTEANFEARKAANAGDRRCLICTMDYRSYTVFSWGMIVAFNGLFGLAAVVLPLRAFGPPTLEINRNGSGVYRLPWRRRTFTIAPGSRITVGAFGLRFDPPLTMDAGPPRDTIPVRATWVDRNRTTIVRQLQAIEGDWQVEGR